MAGIIIISALTLALLLTLFYETSLRIVKSDEYVLSVDLMLFSLHLYPCRKGEKIRKSKAKSKPSRKTNIIGLKKALCYLISNSKISVHRADIEIKECDPAKFALKSQITALFLNLIMLKLCANCRELEINERKTDCDSAQFDITLKFHLYNFLRALLIYFSVKKKIRKRKFNAGYKYKRNYTQFSSGNSGFFRR